MPMLHSRLALAVTIGALSAGCMGNPGGALPTGPQLVLDRTETAPLPAAVAQNGETLQAQKQGQAVAQGLGPIVPAAVQQSRGSGGGGSAGVTGAGHRLRIDLRTFLTSLAPTAQRRVLATVADIDKVVLTVQQPGQTDQVATLAAADIASGVAEFTFDGLPAGNAIVLVVAYDDAGVPIGSAAQVVVLSDTTTSIADMTVQLVPATSTAGPGGTLVTNTTFVDGAPPPSGTELGAYQVVGRPRDLVPGPGGSMYVGSSFYDVNMANIMGNVAFAMCTSVTRLAADGTALYRNLWWRSPFRGIAHAPSTGQLWVSNPGRLIHTDDTHEEMGFSAYALTCDAAGNAFYVDAYQTGYPIYKLTPDGVTASTGMTGFSAMVFDASGNLWTNAYDTAGGDVAASVRKYAPDGTLLGTFPVSSAVHYLALSPTGDLWVAHGTTAPSSGVVAGDFLTTTQSISRLAPDGTVLGTYTATARGLACDAAGNVWVAGPTTKQLAPDGTELASIPFDSHAVGLDDSGYLWAAADMSVVKKFQP